MSINKVMISGNLTRDPEFRQTPNGVSVLAFSVAVNDRRRNQSTGDWEDHPNFVDCTIFGSRAEGLQKYLSKGLKVAIEGRLRWSQWERDGQKRSKLDVIVDNLEFMSSNRNGGNADASDYQTASSQAAPAASTGASDAPVIDGSSSVYDSEEIPF